ncbi:MAG TPA: hypothetical protein DDZ34_08500 [Syntrophaceae bacterium]|nr:hypothetical protein [Syntrophaceae bacterium]
MNKLNKVLNFVRVDGQPTAPVCFLTIEDGGGFTEADLNAPEDAMCYFDTNPVWIPQKGELEKKIKEKGGMRANLGTPGVFISKIMSYLRFSEKEREYEYAKNYLYMRNEMNIKYYPISRSRMAQNIDGLLNFLGLENIQKYYDLCRFVRSPKFISIQDIFNRNKFYIICGIKYEWMDVLKHIFLDTDYFSTESTYTTRETRGNNLAYEFYNDNSGKTTHAYFNMFRRGISDDEVYSFAEQIKIKRQDILNSLCY